MLLSAVYFLCGIVLVQQWAQLPELSYFVVIAAILMALYLVALYYHFHAYLRTVIKVLLLFVAGIGWTIFFAQHSLQYRLPESLAGKTIRVQGEIVGVPVNEKRIKRFYLQVRSFSPVEPTLATPEHAPRKIRLSWYNSKKHRASMVHAGEVWQFLVRLKPPHGFFNPGGFDYERWLFAHGVDASGYIHYAKTDVSWKNKQLSDPSFSIDAYRQKIAVSIKQWLNPVKQASSETKNQLADMTGLVTALAVGERHSIQTQQWQDLLHTGTNHLMAISGLHIGLAYLFGYLFGRWLLAMLLPVSCLQRVPAQYIGIVLGISAAIFYALLAGLSIPTQRALIMLLSFAMAVLLKRNFRPIDALGLALFLILLDDPLSVLSPGFWFSFIAVGVIFYTLTDNPLTSKKFSEKSAKYVWLPRVVAKFRLWIRLQFMITLALFPLSLFLFQQSSLVAPLANLILVPYVSFLVVPFVLLALVFYPFFPLVSELAVQLAAGLLHLIWFFVHGLANLPFAYITQGAVSWWQLLTAMLAILLYLIPARYFYRLAAQPADYQLSAPQLTHSSRFMRLRQKTPVWLVRLILAIVLLMPLLFALIIHRPSINIARGAFKLTVLDVGQGLASVIETSHHTLVFDSGPKLGPHLDAGTAVVVPYLRSRGIRQLDTLVISHGDSDHIGGANSILATYPGVKLIGQDLQRLHSVHKSACYQGLKWSWDGVYFQFLHPLQNKLSTTTGAAVNSSRHKKRNNHSCVLKISAAGGAALFTGDIESSVEKRLLKAVAATLPADVLVVPHHGSKTSSTVAFIKTVHPRIAIMAVGYRNRYRLPSRKVVKRYQQIHSFLFKTGLDGAISMLFMPGNGLMDVEAYRQSHHHYWNWSAERVLK